ncbi:MAG: recombinase family protein [Bifidobacteriaceae bacterium]|jgi:DNA invertase Pin-like site-specific DNA recombinase|nr:recombinase family protein [Bifidobacteriaceae bacterium]
MDEGREMVPLRAVVYVRISDDPEGLERGVVRQEADCRAYATGHAMRVVEVFKENDTSAFKQRVVRLPSGERVRRVVRPQFRAMLGFLAGGGADVMVAYDLDRAVRDPRDLEDLIDAKVLNGFQVRSVTGSLRLDGDADVAMARVLVAMANKSSADTARRVARAARQQAVEGAWHGGRPPFGYRAEGGRLVVVPERAALVQEAAARILAGETVYRILCDWRGRGVRTSSGAVWTDRSLQIVLRACSVKGVREYRPVQPDGTRAKTPEVLVKASWEPILDEDTWERVGAVLDARKQARCFFEGGSSKRLFPFSGIIRCGACGTAMTHRGPVYQCVGNYKGCYRAIRAEQVTDLVEQAVLAVFEQISLDPKHRRRGPGAGRAARADLAAVLESDRARLARLDDDHYDGLIDRAGWVRQRARIAERIEKTRREYTAAAPEAGPVIDAATVAAEWEGRAPAWQHQAASLVLEAVLIHAPPKGTKVRNPRRRRGETPEAFRARRAEALAPRVEFVWRA